MLKLILIHQRIQDKRAAFSSWAGKRSQQRNLGFSSWAGKRAAPARGMQGFSSWAGKRAPFTSWAGKRSDPSVPLTQDYEEY